MGLHGVEELDQVFLRAEEGREPRDAARVDGSTVDRGGIAQGAIIPFASRPSGPVGRLLLAADPDSPTRSQQDSSAEVRGLIRDVVASDASQRKNAISEAQPAV